MNKITKRKLINRQEVNAYNGKSILSQMMSINLAVSNLFSKSRNSVYERIINVENILPRKYAFSLLLIVSALFSNPSFSQSMIQIRQKAVSEEISPDFTYNTLGAAISNFKTTAL